MHSLAIELKRLGFIVTGSDDAIYEPSKSSLINSFNELISYNSLFKPWFYC